MHTMNMMESSNSNTTIHVDADGSADNLHLVPVSFLVVLVSDRKVLVPILWRETQVSNGRGLPTGSDFTRYLTDLDVDNRILRAGFCSQSNKLGKPATLQYAQILSLKRY